MKKYFLGLIIAVMGIMGVIASTVVMAAAPECYLGSSDTQLCAVSKNAALYTMLVAAYDDNGKMVDYEIVRNKNNSEHFAVMEYDDNLSYRAYMWDMGILNPGRAPVSYLPDSDFQNCAVTEFDGELLQDCTERQINVYKNENTNEIVRYKLSGMAKLYVNGREFECWDIVEAIWAFASEGVVTLVDIPSESDGYVDGKYDYILVDYYATGIVDEVYNDGDVTEIVISYSNDDELEEIVVDKESDVTYSFKDTNGNDILPEDIPVGAVVSVAYNVNEGCEYSDFYNVIVSNDTVEGVVESTYTDTQGMDWYVINGVAYKWANVINDRIEAGSRYILYLDKDGNIGWRKEVVDINKYAIVDRYFESAGDSKVRLIHMDGTKADYIIDEDDSYASDVLYVGAAESLNRTLAEDGEAGLQCRFVEYAVNSDNEVRLDSVYSSEFHYGSDDEYRVVSSRVGSYAMDENTLLLDATAYANNSTKNVDVITAENLENYTNYDVVVLGLRDSYTNTYPVMIFVSGSIINKTAAEDTIVEEGYAIVDRYFESAGDNKVRLVHAGGTKTDYIIAEDNSDAWDVLPVGVAESLYYTLEWDGEAGLRKRFVKYAVSSTGEVRLDSIDNSEFDYVRDVEFDKSSDRIGDYAVDENSILLDATDYVHDSWRNANSITVDNLEDETIYDVIVLGGENQDSSIIIIILSGSVDVEEEPEQITEEGYAIVDRYFESAGDNKVRLIHMDGTKADYIIDEDNSDAWDVLPVGVAKSLYYTLDEEGEEGLRKRFVKYTVDSRNNVSLDAVGESEFAFDADAKNNESIGAIGDYIVDENTALIDATAYTHNPSKAVEDVTLEELKNATVLSVVAIGEKDIQTGAYPTIIILQAGIGYTENTRLSIVQSAVTKVSVDDVLMDKIMVVSGEDEPKAIYADMGALDFLQEGDAIIYYTDLQGNLEDCEIIYSVSDMRYELSGEPWEGMFGKLYTNAEFAGENGDTVEFELWPILKKYTSGVDLATDACENVYMVNDMGETYDYAMDAVAYEYDGTLKKNYVSKLASTSMVKASTIRNAAKNIDEGTINLAYTNNELAYALVRMCDGEIKELYNIYFD